MTREAGDSLISHFFDPRGIAIIGSFREGHFGGYVTVKSLIGAGYHGAVYPVNPGYREVHGIRLSGAVGRRHGRHHASPL